MYEWAEKMDCAVTVCDTQGTILFMNEKSRKTFENGEPLVGKNLWNCHSTRSQEIIKRLLAEGGKNVYTIQKKGIKKLIYQTAWYEGGRVGGLVELSMELPSDMPHYVRE